MVDSFGDSWNGNVMTIDGEGNYTVESGTDALATVVSVLVEVVQMLMQRTMTQMLQQKMVHVSTIVHLLMALMLQQVKVLMELLETVTTMFGNMQVVDTTM